MGGLSRRFFRGFVLFFALRCEVQSVQLAPDEHQKLMRQRCLRDSRRLVPPASNIRYCSKIHEVGEPIEGGNALVVMARSSSWGREWTAMAKSVV